MTFALSATKSESDGNAQDLETFDMNPSIPQGSRADWVSDFLAAAGQPRIDPNNDPRIVLDDFTMPDWCFLDDADPDWDAACEQINESEYQQFDVNLTWDINDRWTFTSITGLSEFESHGIADWVMIGTEKRHNDTESDVVYQELQLNAAFDRFDLVTGLSYFQEDVYGSPGTGSPNYDRRGTSSLRYAGRQWQRRRRRHRPERLVRRGRHRRPTGLAVARGVCEPHLAHHRSAQSHARRALRARRERSDGDAVPGLRLRAGRRLAENHLRRRRLGQHRLAAHARLRDQR